MFSFKSLHVLETSACSQSYHNSSLFPKLVPLAWRPLRPRSLATLWGRTPTGSRYIFWKGRSGDGGTEPESRLRLLSHCFLCSLSECVTGSGAQRETTPLFIGSEAQHEISNLLKHFLRRLPKHWRRDCRRLVSQALGCLAVTQKAAARPRLPQQVRLTCRCPFREVGGWELEMEGHPRKKGVTPGTLIAHHFVWSW